MAQTYAELQEKIAGLQAEARQVRQQELAAIITRMRADIKTFEITPQDLFGKVAATHAQSKPKLAATPKFADGKGNEWIGRGARPKWLRDALAAGKKLEEFVFGSAASAGEAVPAARKAAAKRPGSKKTAMKKSKAPGARK